MADPHHKPDLDGFDRITVRLYRLGLWVAALSLLGDAALRLTAVSGVPTPLLGVDMGVALAVANMHLYAKHIRWVIGGSCLVGLLLQVSSTHVPPMLGVWVTTGGLGFVFVSLSAFALKEQFCFRIPGLKAVPALLALSLAPMLLESELITGLLLLPAGGVLTILAWQKSSMPLHFDVGDKSKYQV